MKSESVIYSYTLNFFRTSLIVLTVKLGKQFTKYIFILPFYEIYMNIP